MARKAQAATAKNTDQRRTSSEKLIGVDETASTEEAACHSRAAGTDSSSGGVSGWCEGRDSSSGGVSGWCEGRDNSWSPNPFGAISSTREVDALVLQVFQVA